MPNDARMFTSSTRKQDRKSAVTQTLQVTPERHHLHFVRTALATGVLFIKLREAEECFGGCMAEIIEFYIPQRFRKVSKWLPPNERGKLLEFPALVRKSA